MKARFMVDPALAGIAGAVCAVSLAVSGALLWIQRPGSAAVFLVIGLLFLGLCLINASVVTADEDGITRRLGPVRIRHFSWEEIREFGVCGTKVFNGANSKKTGRLYFYCSKTTMDDDQRFSMILKWPPKEQIYFLYTEKRLESLRQARDFSVETYNTGDLRL